MTFSLQTIDHFLQILVPVCAFAFTYYTIRAKTPPLATQDAAIGSVIALLADDMANRRRYDAIICDLGSGWGGVALAVGKAFPQARVIGYEMAWPAWLVSTLRRIVARQSNVQFRFGNLWKHNISDVDIVFCYLGPVNMIPLGAKLRAEAKTGRLIISNTFPLPKDWVPEQRISIPASVSKVLYVYRQ